MAESEKQRDLRKLGATIPGTIAAAVLLAGLAAGIWYMLRGSRETLT